MLWSFGLWFRKLLITFFASLDRSIYNFISTLYDLLLTIARTSILSQGQISDFADRIYMLLGAFMLFKVAFSLITYVVNPDDFADKSKGLASLGKNAVISLCMLVLVPYVFRAAYELQTIILEDNVIARVILGTGEEGEDNSYLNSAGDTMAYMTMLPFFTPNTSIVSLHECTILTIDGKINEECFGLAHDASGNIIYENNSNKGLVYVAKNLLIYNYATGIEKQNFGLMFRNDLAVYTMWCGDGDDNECSDQDSTFVMDYKWPWSTVVGVIVCLILISFCMDVAVRSVKLAFLQLIYPIPVISYIDPKSGKDGFFKKWYKMCFSTYLSLFLRLAALYFAVYIISEVGSLTDVITGASINNGFVMIFIIIGTLMFAKQLPKLLENLGVKVDGEGFTLNPLKKLEKDALGGKAISTAAKRTAGLAAVPLVGAASLVSGRGLRGMGTAALGALKGEKFGKNFSNSYAAGLARKRQLDQMKADGVSPGSVRWQNIKNAFGAESLGEKATQVENKSKAIQSYYDAIKNQAIACDLDDSIYTTDSHGNKIYQKSAKTIAKELDEMKKTQINRSDFSSDGAYEAAISAQKQRIMNQEKALERRINDLANGREFQKDIVDAHGVSRTITVNGTQTASADKVIQESKSAMISLRDAVNATGKEVDKDFVINDAANDDVVMIMKKAKGTLAQSTSGKFSDVKDIDKYTKKKK